MPSIVPWMMSMLRWWSGQGEVDLISFLLIPLPTSPLEPPPSPIMLLGIYMLTTLSLNYGAVRLVTATFGQWQNWQRKFKYIIFLVTHQKLNWSSFAHTTGMPRPWNTHRAAAAHAWAGKYPKITSNKSFEEHAAEDLGAGSDIWMYWMDKRGSVQGVTHRTGGFQRQWWLNLIHSSPSSVISANGGGIGGWKFYISLSFGYFDNSFSRYTPLMKTSILARGLRNWGNSWG